MSSMQKDTSLGELKLILIKRLEKLGLSPCLIPGFIRATVRAIADMGEVTLKDVNARLNILGWDDLKLDDHTFQLIIAGVERNDLPLPEPSALPLSGKLQGPKGAPRGTVRKLCVGSNHESKKTSCL